MGVRWDNAEPGTSMCSQAEEPAPSLPDLGLLCMDKIKVLIEATLQRKESPDARTLLDGFMKIKWLLDVCLSPGQELQLWKCCRILGEKRSLHNNYLCFLSSHHLMQESPGLSLCCLCPLTPCLVLSPCSLSQMITQHTFKGPA